MYWLSTACCRWDSGRWGRGRSGTGRSAGGYPLPRTENKNMYDLYELCVGFTALHVCGESTFADMALLAREEYAVVGFRWLLM